MKKILIVSHAMELGGAERALLGLLNNFDYEEYEVDLFLQRHFGELLDSIPKQVHLLPENASYACMGVPASQVIKKGKLRVAFGRFYGKKKAAQFIKKSNYKNGFDVLINYSEKHTVKFMPEISKTNYDLVISFLTPHYFAAKKTRAKKKIAWIHTDYTAIEIDRSSELEMWSEYDNIISISPDVTKSFLKVFPELKEKIIVVENMHPTQFIKNKSLEFDPIDEMPNDSSVKLLSVGRFCTAKNFDNVPFICEQLVNKHGLDVKWYIIGYGTDTSLIEENIKKAGMQNNVIILGKKDNPYPYMRRCDFYVQPSRFEGNAVTVNEALILSKLVVITNYSTAASQIKHEENGVIVPIKNELCANGVAQFINNGELHKKILKNIINEDFSNSQKIEKIYELMR